MSFVPQRTQPRASEESRCNGKLKFQSFTSAAKAAKRTSRAKGREGEHYQAYHCTTCQSFHVGSMLGHKPKRPKIYGME